MTFAAHTHGTPAQRLPEYFAQLGVVPAESLAGVRVAATPSAALLHRLLQQHLARIPFSSVSVQLGADMPLALPALFERLVSRSRGGYCFEQNALLQAMLEAAGFATCLVLARVIYGQDIHPGLTHRLMLVKLDGVDYVVDVGFGALGPRVPVPLGGEEQADGWRRFRVAEQRAGEFHLQCWQQGAWFSLYRFERHRYGDSDCELGHFYSHRHPSATFVNHLVVARLLPDRILSLRNRDYRVMTAEGEESAVVATVEALLALLTREFGLAVTPAEAALLFGRLVR